MLEGAVLNQRYRLLNRLGEGGMAVVYRAEDLLLGRTVAVKALREDLARDEAFLARFQTEARAAANLSHPNIAAIYDVGFDAGRHYIVMEYVDGPTLKDLIRQGAPFSVGRAVDLAAQILSALEHAHGRGVLHRDIKPQNVLLTADGRAKVVDFGIARLLAAASTTQTGEVFGTAYYLAPERARGEEAKPAADVYAVGIILYEMLTGRLPFTGDTPIEVALKHLQEQPAAPSALNPAIPPRLEAVVLQSMAKDPAQRFASAGAMRQALLSYAHTAADTTAALGVGRRVIAGPPPSRVAATPASQPAAAAVARTRRGVPWTTALLVVVAAALLVVLVPMGTLFYTAFLRPFFSGQPGPGPGPVATATSAPTATATVTASPTATHTPTVSPTATRTATPTASPTPRYPAWMRFIAEQPQLQLVKDNKQRLGEVRGEILDRAGNRVPGLIVRIESEDGQWSAERPRANVDQADGTFRFDQLNRGRYKLMVLDANRKPISQTVQNLATDDVDKDFKGYPIFYVTFREPTE